VVSNKIYRLALKLLQGLGVENCFDAVFGGDSAADKKPHPALLNAALTKFGLPATAR
jgi:phosphoglycolate phosphatase-like HAD superfamily hydrolase